MSPASRGLAPREGLESLLVKMGQTGPLAEPRRGPQAGKSGDPHSQNANNTVDPSYILIVSSRDPALWRSNVRRM